MWDKLLIGIAAFFAYLIFHRILIAPRQHFDDYERRLREVLNREDHKVKGRFE